MVDVIPKQPLDHLSLWRGQELQERADWQIHFTEPEIDELLLAAESLTDRSAEKIELTDIELPKLVSIC